LVNDALMAVFFIAIGIELRREWVHGVLQQRRTAVAALCAAAAGMALPAVIYLTATSGHPGSAGWGIPMATDVPLMLAAVLCLGHLVPPDLRTFLLTLAVADDAGALLVTSAQGHRPVHVGWLLTAGALVAVLVLFGRRRGNWVPFAAIGVLLWVAVIAAGLPGTLAGLFLGLAAATGTHSTSPRYERALLGFVQLAIVPAFVLANTGIALDANTIDSSLKSPVTWGVITGFIAGKTIGISAATALVIRLRIGVLPPSLDLWHVVGGAALAGIGFTVALLVTELSLHGELVQEAKIGVLIAAVASVGLGAAILWMHRTIRT
jgi:NhaA family Na+:H+ antiporter